MEHEAPDVPVGAVVGVLEAERALQPEPPAGMTPHAHPGGMDGLVEQLHPGGAAGRPPHGLGAFGRGATGAPECERGPRNNHQDQ